MRLNGQWIWNCIVEEDCDRVETLEFPIWYPVMKDGQVVEVKLGGTIQVVTR